MSWNDPCSKCGETRANCECLKNQEVKQEKAMKIKTKQIGSFLGGLNPAERRFLEMSMNLSNNIQSLVKDNDWVTQEVFCSRVGIDIEKYNDFISGNWNYDMMNIAAINALHAECEMKKTKPIVSVAGS